MALNRFHIVSPLALMAFSACRSPYLGEGGAVGGAVVNGPLNSALVFLDYDFDGILDANEPNARTNQFGEYELTATQGTYDLVAIADAQTVDTSSGATFAGITLKAPSGAGVISPTSTLMSEGNLTATEVAAVLGLPDGVDPLTFNPFNVDENDAAAVAQALEVAKISKQITTAISSFASATEGAGADAADAFNTALNSVVEVVKTKAAKAKDTNASAAEKTLDFTTSNDLDLIKTQVTTKATSLKGLDATTLNALADDTTAAVKNVNAKIKAVTNLNSEATKDIFSTTQVLRDQIKDVAVARKEGKAGDITFKDLSAVETAMSNKAPEAITLSGDRLMSPDKGSLVVGKLATVDGDQGSGVAFTYTLDGKDADMFSFNASTGELSLKAKPDYAKKPFYDVTVITKDAGGKKFAENFKIDVVPEFKGLVAPTSKAASDFKEIIEQNPLFKDMINHTVLKQTADGQLVLEEKGQGLSTEAPKPIMAVVKLTERGYELHNPANDKYMSGFFKYETGGLTYTGYEVFIENRNMLGENQKDLFKYFSANNAYGSKKLPFSERDVDFISIAGAKITDKDGNIVSDMYGFNHYDKDLKVLGSTGIDIATTDKPLYIEVTGAFVPGVTTNITATSITKANADAMKAVIEKAGGAVLYGEKTTTFGQEHSHSETSESGSGSPSESGSHSESGSGVGETGNPSGLVESGSSSSGPKSGEVYETSHPRNPSFLIVDSATSGKFDVIPVKIKSGGSGYEFDASRKPETAFDVAADKLYLSIGRDPTKKADVSNSDASTAVTAAKADTTAPTLSNVSIASNNTDTKEAEPGDNVTLTFTASEAIGTPVVTFKSGGAAISDSSVTYTNTTGNTWTAVYTADASDTLGAVSFSIAYSDKASNAGTPVTSGTGTVTTDEKIDSVGPLFTQFSVKTSEASLGENIKIEFKATDDTYVGYFNASFSSVDDPNKKIDIKAQNKKNTDSLSDHFDFFLNSNNTYEVSFPVIFDGELKDGKYVLENFSATDANTKTNPNINNESKYGPSVLSADNVTFFNNLSSKDFLIKIPVLENNPGLPEIKEQESNARWELANSILPDNVVTGTVFPGGEDWFKFDLTSAGTIVAQIDLGQRSADLQLFDSNINKIIGKEVVKSGMIHHTASDSGEYYLLVRDANLDNSAYEMILDVI
jgi:hypothetical protein